MEKRYINIKECSEYIGISVDTLYQWSRVSKIPVHKVSNLLRFDKYEIDKWMHKFKRVDRNSDLLEK